MENDEKYLQKYKKKFRKQYLKYSYIFFFNSYIIVLIFNFCVGGNIFCVSRISMIQKLQKKKTIKQGKFGSGYESSELYPS